MIPLTSGVQYFGGEFHEELYAPFTFSSKSQFRVAWWAIMAWPDTSYYLHRPLGYGGRGGEKASTVPQPSGVAELVDLGGLGSVPSNWTSARVTSASIQCGNVRQTVVNGTKPWRHLRSLKGTLSDDDDDDDDVVLSL